jgi:hypothetical protein
MLRSSKLPFSRLSTLVLIRGYWAGRCSQWQVSKVSGFKIVCSSVWTGWSLFLNGQLLRAEQYQMCMRCELPIG